MKVLTLIPARGGSKGIPRKNLRLIGGKPLLAWTVDAAKSSRLGCNCYVTTEDIEIAGVAADLGAQVILRPAELANDLTPMVDVVEHALKVCEVSSVDYTHILLLQPTSPLRTAEDVDNSLLELLQSNADSVIGVTIYEGVHPSKMYTLEEGYLRAISQDLAKPCRQQLASIYRRNGAIFGCTRKFFDEKKCLWGGKIQPYLMPMERSVDIDSPEDLLEAHAHISKSQGLAVDSKTK